MISEFRRPILVLSQGADFYGSNLIMLESAKHLMSAGYPVHVIFPLEGPIIEEFRKQGIKTEILNLAILRRKYLTFFGLINRTLYFLIAIIRLIILIKKQNITIVYSNGLGVLVGYFASIFAGVTHVWHIHEIIERPAYFRIFYRRLLNMKFGQSIAVSEAVKSFWTTKDSSNIHRIYNGIPAPNICTNPNKLREELKLPKDTILLGMIGRVNYFKGQDYFLEIAQRLLEHDPNLRFIMVGDVFPGYEDLYDKLNQLKKTLGMSHAVFDLGYRRDIPDILDALDLFVLPSTLPDPFPTVILEAMQQGKAIVSTRQGGAVEMLEDSVSGAFIPIHQPQAAADIILPLLQNEDKRRKMGSAAKEKVSRDFSSENFKENLLKKINTLYIK